MTSEFRASVRAGLANAATAAKNSAFTMQKTPRRQILAHVLVLSGLVTLAVMSWTSSDASATRTVVQYKTGLIIVLCVFALLLITNFKKFNPSRTAGSRKATSNDAKTRDRELSSDFYVFAIAFLALMAGSLFGIWTFVEVPASSTVASFNGGDSGVQTMTVDQERGLAIAFMVLGAAHLVFLIITVVKDKQGAPNAGLLGSAPD